MDGNDSAVFTFLPRIAGRFLECEACANCRHCREEHPASLQRPQAPTGSRRGREAAWAAAATGSAVASSEQRASENCHAPESR